MMRLDLRWQGPTLVAVTAVGLAAAAQAAKDETSLISRQSAADGGAPADRASFDPSISPDGRFVAFSSRGANLSAEDSDQTDAFGQPQNDIFVRDTEAGTTTFVSRQGASDGGAGGDGDSFDPAVSTDGQIVAFGSRADNLSTDDVNAHINVFVRDVGAGTSTLVSRQSAADGGAGADGDSGEPAISADGRYVAFESSAGNLSADDGNEPHVYLRDTLTDATTLVSRQSAADGGEGAAGGAGNPSISADGRFVAFVSSADNLSSDDSGFSDVFVRDTVSETTTLVSRQSAADGGAGADGAVGDAAISADGRFVAFQSAAANLSDQDEDGGGAFDIFVRDTQSSTTTLASRQSAADGGAGADGHSSTLAISADGRLVVFHSEADNLSSDDNDGVVNTFVRDTQGSTTILVSRQSAADGGAGADGESSPSFDPAISADGRFVAFQSAAGNLAATDPNAPTNIFLRDVLGARPDTQPPGQPAPERPSAEPPSGQPDADRQVRARDSRAPRIRLLGVPDRCTRRGFTLRVRIVEGSRLRRAGVRLDGRPLRSTRRKRFQVRIGTDALREGRHRIAVDGVDRAGNRGARTVSFRRCARPARRAPSFTG